MLKSLYIKNFVLFDDVKINLGDGLNVFAGETGAGKSVLIRAIDVALGGKAGKDLIKPDCNSAFIELTFVCGPTLVDALSLECGVEILEEELTVSREITRFSSKYRLNGILASKDLLIKAREYLVDIHSQHQTYSLLSPSSYLSLLDAFGGSVHKENLEAYSNRYLEYRTLEKELSSLKIKESEVSLRKSFLSYQIREIEEAAICSLDEDERLKSELDVLLNIETLKESSCKIYELLTGEDFGVIVSLDKISVLLGKILAMDSSLKNDFTSFESSFESLKDFSFNIRRYFENLEVSSSRIEFLESRLNSLNSLKKKYGKNLGELVDFLDLLKKELLEIEGLSEEISELEGHIEIVLREMDFYAHRLTEGRKKTASELSSLVIDKLRKLELSKARFLIEISPCDFGSKGKDKVEFLVSANLSHSLAPLAKIASGGELSRIMLALKTVFADYDKIDTIIFDEIDTGISGKAAAAVAEELALVSRKRQILAVTHLGVIASRASSYFYVEKIQKDSTLVTVRELAGKDKLESLACMTFGKATAQSIKSAEALLR